jgi:hypothetical protein
MLMSLLVPVLIDPTFTSPAPDSSAKADSSSAFVAGYASSPVKLTNV